MNLEKLVEKFVVEKVGNNCFETYISQLWFLNVDNITKMLLILILHCYKEIMDFDYCENLAADIFIDNLSKINEEKLEEIIKIVGQQYKELRPYIPIIFNSIFVC